MVRVAQRGGSDRSSGRVTAIVLAATAAGLALRIYQLARPGFLLGGGGLFGGPLGRRIVCIRLESAAIDHQEARLIVDRGGEIQVTSGAGNRTHNRASAGNEAIEES